MEKITTGRGCGCDTQVTHSKGGRSVRVDCIDPNDPKRAFRATLGTLEALSRVRQYPPDMHIAEIAREEAKQGGVSLTTLRDAVEDLIKLNRVTRPKGAPLRPAQVRELAEDCGVLEDSFLEQLRKERSTRPAGDGRTQVSIFDKPYGRIPRYTEQAKQPKPKSSRKGIRLGPRRTKYDETYERNRERGFFR